MRRTLGSGDCRSHGLLSVPAVAGRCSPIPSARGGQPAGSLLTPCLLCQAPDAFRGQAAEFDWQSGEASSFVAAPDSHAHGRDRPNWMFCGAPAGMRGPVPRRRHVDLMLLDPFQPRLDASRLRVRALGPGVQVVPGSMQQHPPSFTPRHFNSSTRTRHALCRADVLVARRRASRSAQIGFAALRRGLPLEDLVQQCPIGRCPSPR